MPDSKISSLTELAEVPASTDEFVIVDKSDTTMALTGTTKKIKASNIVPTEIARASSANPTSISFSEDTDNGTNKITVTAPSAIASDKTLTLPDETGTVATSLIGEIKIYAGASAPTGHLLCDGSSLLRASYPDLFSVIGTTYGSADGTHFTLPNLKGRVVVGVSATDTEFDTLGETGGAKTNDLTHNHTMPIGWDSSFLYTHNDASKTPVFGSDTTSNANRYTLSPGTETNGGVRRGYTSTNGGTTLGSAVSNIQPYIALNYIIKY